MYVYSYTASHTHQGRKIKLNTNTHFESCTEKIVSLSFSLSLLNMVRNLVFMSRTWTLSPQQRRRRDIYIFNPATYLTVEDVLGRGLLELDVPHQGHAVGLVGSVLVVVVGGHQQLGILAGGGGGGEGGDAG